MPHLQKTAEVRTYFTERAQAFDALYDGESAFSRGFNRLFRKPMLTRFIYTLEALEDAEGMRFLDIGCGSGRYAVELARRGAHVTGIDFSPEMIAMARSRARAENMAGQVELVAGDFVAWSRGCKRQFDAAFAMGVLDYVEDAPEFIARMAAVADRVIASFPRPTALRMPLRRLRYGLRNCPVHFYRRAEIERMYAAAGLRRTEVRHIGPGYWVQGWGQ